MERLFLFDIDGTLCDSGNAGSISLNRTFESLLHVPNAFQSIRMDGKTDIQIIREGLECNGISAGENQLKTIVGYYLKQLRMEIDNDRKHLKPGVVELLSALAETAGCHLALLTGNLEAGARIKLEPFGLNPYFPYGAFGSDHEDRRRLVPIALQKFSAFRGRDPAPTHCIVIGDTPLDVACAKPHGATAVAVCTGNYTADQLHRAGADLVLDNLSGAFDLLTGDIP